MRSENERDGQASAFADLLAEVIDLRRKVRSAEVRERDLAERLEHVEHQRFNLHEALRKIAEAGVMPPPLQRKVAKIVGRGVSFHGVMAPRSPRH